MNTFCGKCGEISLCCHCVIDYNKPVPPNVINFDGRPPEARRIADLEGHVTVLCKRVAELEEQIGCMFDLIRARDVRIEVLERVVAGLEAAWGEHIERPHITFALPLRGTVTWGYRDCNGDYRS